MVKLGGILSTLIIEKFGTDEFLSRISDPFWFHSLSLAIGFDWNSSGTTTTTMSALKDYFSESDRGIWILGGKGRKMRDIALEFKTLENSGHLSQSRVSDIRDKGRLIARVDNVLLDDGFDIYLQFIATNANGRWAIVQQGMDPELRLARRYHWNSRSVESWLNDGRGGISSSIIREKVVDLSTSKSEEHRKSMLDLSKTKINSLAFSSARQMTLETFGHGYRTLNLDRRVDWTRLRRIYEYQPSSFEDLFGMRGVGKSTIRAISYLAEVLYGSYPSFTDPIRYSFALGGKDGVPKPVNYRDYDRCIEFYSELLGNLRTDNSDTRVIVNNLERNGFKLSNDNR